MKPNSLLILTAGALALAGCSTPKQVGGGPMHARTFSFVKTAGRPVPGYAQHRMPIPGLYQTGATTHPGGSVTGAPGRNAAMVLLKDLGRDLNEVISVR